MSKYLFTEAGWTLPLIEKTWEKIDKIGKEVFGLDYHQPQIEIVSYEQMLDAYSTTGLPVMYHQWSFGKSFIKFRDDYLEGHSGLAYEMVINTNPAIAYLMETNTMTMQALVLAHACCGHTHFFKNNYLFKEWTDPDAILNYLVFAKNYVEQCEYQYGNEKVAKILDA